MDGKEKQGKEIKGRVNGEKKEGACAFVAADGEASVAVWPSKPCKVSLTEPNGPVRAWPGAASLFALLQRHSLLAGLDRGLAEAGDGGAESGSLRVAGARPSPIVVAKLIRGWLSEMQFFPRDLCDSCLFVFLRSLCWGA